MKKIIFILLSVLFIVNCGSGNVCYQNKDADTYSCVFNDNDLTCSEIRYGATSPYSEQLNYNKNFDCFFSDGLKIYICQLDKIRINCIERKANTTEIFTEYDY